MELRDALARADDLVVVYVLPDNQMNPKSASFFDEAGLRPRMRFGVDPGSAAIDRLGLRRPSPEPMERGVPHPTTLLLDREGVVRMIDVREDFHIWLDPATIVTALSALP